eukprot:2347730-Prymnesium_polylepis.1
MGRGASGRRAAGRGDTCEGAAGARQPIGASHAARRLSETAAPLSEVARGMQRGRGGAAARRFGRCGRCGRRVGTCEVRS